MIIFLACIACFIAGVLVERMTGVYGVAADWIREYRRGRAERRANRKEPRA